MSAKGGIPEWYVTIYVYPANVALVGIGTGYCNSSCVLHSRRNNSSHFQFSGRSQCHHGIYRRICTAWKTSRKHDVQSLRIYGDVSRARIRRGFKARTLYASSTDNDVLGSSISYNLGRIG